MIARQRHDLIVEAVKRAGTVTVPELCLPTKFLRPIAIWIR